MTFRSGNIKRNINSKNSVKNENYSGNGIFHKKRANHFSHTSVHFSFLFRFEQNSRPLTRLPVEFELISRKTVYSNYRVMYACIIILERRDADIYAGVFVNLCKKEAKKKRVHTEINTPCETVLIS